MISNILLVTWVIAGFGMADWRNPALSKIDKIWRANIIPQNL